MTPGEIAKGLSKPQRKTLTQRPERDPHLHQVWNYRRTMDVLDRLGLLQDYHARMSGWAMLSPLGLAVRAILEQESRDE